MADAAALRVWGRGTIAGTMATGWSTVVVQAIGMARTLLLARLLFPDLFGIIALADALLVVGRQLQDFNFEAGLIARRERLAATVTAHLLLKMVFAIGIAGLLVAAAWLLPRWYDARVGVVLLWYVGGSLVQAIGSTPRALLEREFRLTSIAYVHVVSAVIRTVIPVALAWRGHGLMSLIAMNVLDMVVPAMGYWGCRPLKLEARFAWADVRWLLRFGAPIWVAGFLSNVFVLDNLLVGTLCGMEAVGFYALAFTLARLPVQVIAHAVTKGAFPAYALHQRHAPQTTRLFGLAYTAVVWGLVPLATLGVLLAPDIVPLVLGAKWLPLVPVFQWLCIFTVLRGLQDISVDFFVSQGKAAWFRNVLAVEAVVLLVIGPLAAWRGGPVGMAVAVDVMLCAGLPYLLRHLRQLVPLDHGSTWRLPLIASGVMVGTMLAAASWMPGWPLIGRVAAKSAIGLGVVIIVWGTVGRSQWTQVWRAVRDLWSGNGALA